jgi:hypothetical protein
MLELGRFAALGRRVGQRTWSIVTFLRPAIPCLSSHLVLFASVYISDAIPYSTNRWDIHFPFLNIYALLAYLMLFP